MLTDQEIEDAKQKTIYGSDQPYHEHPDCIRIAYEWLDAQKKINSVNSKFHDLKHLVEKWGGRYVSASDVEVAAYLHPEIKGIYPCLNISSRLTEPSKKRLEGVLEAYTQDHHKRHDPKKYSCSEDF